VFAGPETGELTRPRLTSIGPDHTAMARRAIEFLLRRVAGEPAADLQMLSAPVFLDRGSTAAPRPPRPVSPGP
ncbi:hypothetical protein P1N98_05480, partial [Tsukamurella tyrosinosolvens]|uniref:hypothetical protein n=1 Tax=Tsukamurella tyrosinosolvens TaxID=57704 RepID=UPI002480C352